jgi:hypothetical protein
MNLFSACLAVLFALVVAFLWTERILFLRGKSPPLELSVPDTIIWIRRGIILSSVGCWSNYSLARDFGREHLGWDIAVFVLGEILAFLAGYFWSMFLSKATWPASIPALASGFSWLAFVCILSTR